MENLEPAPSPQPPVDPRVFFGQALYAATPRVYFSYLIIALNVAYFVFMCVKGVHWLSPTPHDLYLWGGDYSPVTTHGQWWRLVTSAFMHAGILHLAFNMWALAQVGALTERLFGNYFFLLLYLTSAVVGGVASVWWDGPVASVGASGAIFGVFGALLAYVTLQKSSFPPAAAKSIRNSAAIFVGYNVFIGLSNKGISNAAHLGGLASGLVLAAFIARPLALERRSRQTLVRAALGLLISAGMIGGAIAIVPRFSGPIDPIRFDLMNERFDREQEEMHNLYKQIVAELNEGKISADVCYRKLQEQVIARHDVLIEWLAPPKEFEASENAQRRELLRRFFVQRRAGIVLVAEGIKVNDVKKAAAGREIMEDAVDRFNAVIEAESRPSTRK